ncbi:Uncharacterised protein g8446 [Pycnogonum litorale]
MSRVTVLAVLSAVFVITITGETRSSELTNVGRSTVERIEKDQADDEYEDTLLALTLLVVTCLLLPLFLGPPLLISITLLGSVLFSPVNFLTNARSNV